MRPSIRPASALSGEPGVLRCGLRGRAFEPLLVGLLVTLVCVALNVLRNHAGIHPRHQELGGEYFHIATALREGRGFADPFGAGTGPTGWMPPAFTFLLWATNGLTQSGGQSYSAAFIPTLIALKCVALGASAGLIWALLRAWRLPRAYLIAFGISWTLLVAWAQWDAVTASMHDGWWVASIACVCLYGIVRPGPARSSVPLMLGLCLAVLSSPILYLATLVTLAARACTLGKKSRSRRVFWRSGLKPLLPALGLSLLCGGGWSLYIHATTGIWAPVKTNGGFELWQSLERTSHGIPTHSTFALHPESSPPLREEYARLGEKAFLEKYTRAALRSLAEDPWRYVDHVLHRAANAALWMQRRRDTLAVSGAIPGPVAAELQGARLIVPAGGPDKWLFLFVRESDAERAEILARLSPAAGDYLRTAWQYNDAEEGAGPWWGKLPLRELALSGLVTLSWALALLVATPRLRRRLLPALVLYVGILTPYLLVSHYYRYQEMLLGLQVLALTAAIGGLAELRRSRRARPPAGETMAGGAA